MKTDYRPIINYKNSYNFLAISKVTIGDAKNCIFQSVYYCVALASRLTAFSNIKIDEFYVNRSLIKTRDYRQKINEFIRLF